MDREKVGGGLFFGYHACGGGVEVGSDEVLFDEAADNSEPYGDGSQVMPP
jgi:hypothetical protein